MQASLVVTIQWDDPNDYTGGQEQLQRLYLLQDRIFLFHQDSKLHLKSSKPWNLSETLLYLG